MAEEQSTVLDRQSWDQVGLSQGDRSMWCRCCPGGPEIFFIPPQKKSQLKMRASDLELSCPGLGSFSFPPPSSGSFSAKPPLLPESSLGEGAAPSTIPKPYCGLQPQRCALADIPGELGVALTPFSVHRTSSKPRPAELSRMSAAQRLQLL